MRRRIGLSNRRPIARDAPPRKGLAGPLREAPPQCYPYPAMRLLNLLLLLELACQEQPRSSRARARPAPRPPPVAAADASAPPDGGADRDGGSDPDVLAPSVGLAAYFMTNVFAEPRFDSRRLGWIRVGEKHDVGPLHPGDQECPGGFRPLTKTRGWVCEGKGIVVGRYPATLRHGTQPAKRDALIPYDYGYVRVGGTPLYRRAPTWEQVQEIEYPQEPDAGPGGGGARADTETEAEADAEPDTEADTDIRHRFRYPISDSDSDIRDRLRWPGACQLRSREADEPEEPEEPEELDTHGGLVVRSLAEGFILSIDRQLGEWPNLLYRTIRGQWVNARKVRRMRATTFRGVEVGDGEVLAIAFAAGRPRARHERNARGRIVPRGQVPGSFGFVVARELDERRVHWLEAPDGALYRAAGLTVVRPAPPPEGLAAGEKWIDVNVTHQTLVAYEGTRPVFATLVSSGSEARGFATPPGRFRIRSKHVTFTMDGDLEGDGAYSIEDVPYVMYYDLSYALHAAFWHSFFGRQRSHGCVNLSAADAHWIFDWVEPQLPAGWYGVWADDAHPGDARGRPEAGLRAARAAPARDAIVWGVQGRGRGPRKRRSSAPPPTKRRGSAPPAPGPGFPERLATIVGLIQSRGLDRDAVVAELDGADTSEVMAALVALLAGIGRRPRRRHPRRRRPDGPTGRARGHRGRGPWATRRQRRPCRAPGRGCRRPRGSAVACRAGRGAPRAPAPHGPAGGGLGRGRARARRPLAGHAARRPGRASVLVRGGRGRHARRAPAGRLCRRSRGRPGARREAAPAGRRSPVTRMRAPSSSGSRPRPTAASRWPPGVRCSRSARS